MLQRYLDSSDFEFPANFGQQQKSPGQQSSDSGFSGDNKAEGTSQCFSESCYNGEDLSQLVDQVLSSIDSQFPDELVQNVNNHGTGSDSNVSDVISDSDSRWGRGI